jgi:hypothetical protein
LGDAALGSGFTFSGSTAGATLVTSAATVSLGFVLVASKVTDGSGVVLVTSAETDFGVVFLVALAGVEFSAVGTGVSGAATISSGFVLVAATDGSGDVLATSVATGFAVVFFFCLKRVDF